MANQSRATQAKRNRERSRQERQQEKREQRAIRKETKKNRPDDLEAGIDPDLLGIVPGPQPPMEY